MEIKKGQVISDREYSDLRDAAKNFLKKYQTYTKIDSAIMMDMLDNVDLTKNSTGKTGNTKLTTRYNDKTGITSFNWYHSVNGADYTSLQVGFKKNGILDSLYDNRAVYSIGDTSVNIPSEQAINIAMEYLQTHTYAMPNNVKINDFNITENLTTAKLEAYPINSTELRPYWNVKLYLNKTYPGNVQGFSSYIWGNSGELFSCTNIAHGGVEHIRNSNIESTTSSLDSNPQSESSLQSLTDILFAAGSIVGTIGLAIGSLVIVNKRKK
jgi:hypothetical protein